MAQTKSKALESGTYARRFALDPERTPSPQAYSKFVTKAELQKLADDAGVSLASLGQITVSSTAFELWDAITEYLSFSPVPKGHSCIPLHIKLCRKDKDDDVSSDDEDSSDDSDNENGNAGNSNQPLRPEFELAPSSVQFLWPPPPHLKAKALVAARGEKTSISPHDVIANGDGCASASDAGDGVERNLINLFYYNIGTPQATFRDLKVLSEMLLIYPTGTRPLTRFCEEVLAWHQALHKTSDLRSRFPLHRFKMECGEGRWAYEGLKRARPADSVILSGQQMGTILSDIEKFRGADSRDWYFRHGLPYRRAYLFYGPPGTGKTSTVRVIASKFELACCSLSMANHKFSNQALGDALSNMPKNALLVLEDVDALFNEDRSNKLDNSLTFSGMLNALDGLASVEGLITVMTTNHIERLEKALIRGGRVDRRFKFDLPGTEELTRLFVSFYPSADMETCKNFVKTIMARPEGPEARGVSALQQLFIEMRERTAEQCVSGMTEFFDRYFPQENVNVINGTSSEK